MNIYDIFKTFKLMFLGLDSSLIILLLRNPPSSLVGTFMLECEGHSSALPLC